jgi:hypothetical protein
MKKIIYSQRLLMVPSPESGRKVYFTNVPEHNTWAKDDDFMVFRKHRNSFEPLRTPHIRTHKKGTKIRSISTFRKWAMNGNPIYYNHKFMHYGFAVSMPFRSVCDALSQGRIWKAVRI